MVAKNKHNYFITIEGIEGVGKSTCVQFIEQYLKEHGIDVVLTREPGGTSIAEDIRQVLLQHHEEKMAIDTELLLMFAGRAQHIATVINPALNNNQWVISDRFTDASYAYQGGGRGIDKERIQLLEDWVQRDLRPDLTILLIAPVEIALERMKGRGSPDRIEEEKKEFFEKVQKNYLERAAQFPERFRVIDANSPFKIVKLKLSQILDELLNSNGKNIN